MKSNCPGITRMELNEIRGPKKVTFSPQSYLSVKCFYDSWWKVHPEAPVLFTIWLQDYVFLSCSWLTIMGVKGRTKWCDGLSWVSVCWQWEDNSSWVHKTEEGVSSAGTVLMLLSQSGLVAMCAVNLPLCVAERERGTHIHTQNTHDSHLECIDLKNHLSKSSGRKLEKFEKGRFSKRSYLMPRLLKTFW